MRVKEQRRRNLYVVLLIIICSIGMGYALLSTTLTINGTSKIKGNTWDIHFENYVATSNSTVLPEDGKVPDTSGNNKTTISYEINFNLPGDVYEFTVDAKNAGSIDAMIESITSTIKIDDGEEVEINSTSDIPGYLNYSVTYTDNNPLAVKQELKAGSFETYKVRIEFKRDINSTQLNEASLKTIDMTFSVTYIQADGTEGRAHPLEYVYASWKGGDDNYNYNIDVGDAFNPSNNTIIHEYSSDSEEDIIPTFSTPLEAFRAFQTASGYENVDMHMCLKYKLQNNEVISSSVVFTITDEMVQEHPEMTAGTYTLEYDSNDTNKEKLQRAFGMVNCEADYENYTCSIPGVIYAGTSGTTAGVDEGDFRCAFGVYGESSCYILS